MSLPRYFVSSVTGYNMRGDSNGREVTDYLVLDRELAFRVVAEFPAQHGGHGTQLTRKAKADELAASLNAGEEAWRDALARDSEHGA